MSRCFALSLRSYIIIHIGTRNKLTHFYHLLIKYNLLKLIPCLSKLMAFNLFTNSNNGCRTIIYRRRGSCLTLDSMCRELLHCFDRMHTRLVLGHLNLLTQLGQPEVKNALCMLRKPFITAESFMVYRRFDFFFVYYVTALKFA